MKTSVALLGFLVSAGIGFAMGRSVETASRVPRYEPTTKKAHRSVLDTGPLYRVPIQDSAWIGSNRPLVTIVVFSDFQCPFCARVQPALKRVLETYGDVRLVFKHFPLAWHREAEGAAELALGASGQGKFWEMHDLLFANQQALDRRSLQKHAKNLKLDQEKLDAFYSSGRGKERVREDIALARQLGVHGAPAFFINGARLTGAQPFENFQRLIDHQLEEALRIESTGVTRDRIYEHVQRGALKRVPKKRRAQDKEKPATRREVKLRSKTPWIGDPEPLVTIVAFADFQCPFSGRMATVLQQVVREHSEEVQVRFRHLPLSHHKRSLPAAKAAIAAQKQGKFWSLHDLMFANQRDLSDADLSRYARELRLNTKKMTRDMGSTVTLAHIRRDIKEARVYGAHSTPTLFINGVPLRGAQPHGFVKGVVEQELAFAKSIIESGVSRGNVYREVLRREAGKPFTLPSSAAPGTAEHRARVTIPLEGVPVLGEQTAPVKIVVYSEFTCAACGTLARALEIARSDYDGRVLVAFKQFPLPSHRNAELAAVASVAAHRQGLFWVMHDRLFAHKGELTQKEILRLASEANLDADRFAKDLEDRELIASVKAQKAEGVRLGIGAPPALFINGKQIAGHPNHESIKAAIEAELK